MFQTFLNLIQKIYMTNLLNQQNVRSSLAELVGTLFLTLAALLSGTPYAVGLTLAVFVYAIGDVSGSHINPAVTVGLLINRSIALITGVFYIVAQIVGALLARLVGSLMANVAVDYPTAGVLGEFFGFGLLMLSIVAVYEKNVPKSGSGVAIGAALAAGLLTTQGILNPAIAIAMGQTISPGTWAPLLSGVIFTILFRFLANKKPIPPGA
jgi:aquaporin Z